MDDRNNKIISLRDRRAQETERRRLQAEAARSAERRRKLAEHGPAAGRLGRAFGTFGAVLIVALLVAGVVVVAWLHLARQGIVPGPH